MTWRPFSRVHFNIYKLWFEDAELNKHLGPIDEEWLTYVHQEEDGQQYAVFQDGIMVGVVGVKHPSTEDEHLYITDIAVCPDLRGRGIGSEMLSDLTKVYPDISRGYWVAFVSATNIATISFFAKNNWVSNSGEVDEDNMLRFVPFMAENPLPDTNTFSSQ